jgi:hypothetical protein
MGLYEELKAIEPFSLSAHHDADGVYSATILKRIFNVKEVKFPEFGFYTTQVAVDLGSPEDKTWTGIVIDHHPDHPEDRKYKLYWDHCPTGLVLFNNLKEHVKSEDSWLVVGSLTGDGQPELTPDEIWDKFPELLSGRGVLYKNQWGKLGTSQTLLYKFLSSGINSLCRLGRPEQAMRVLEGINSPIQLLENAEVIDAVDSMRKEKESLFDKRSCKPPVVETLGNYSLVRIKTSRPEIKLAGVLATELSCTDNNTTYIVINEADGSGSVRGDLAKHLANKLTKAGFKAGGHGAYCGVKVSLVDLDNLIETIRRATKE